jgi:SET domain-containing protein
MPEVEVRATNGFHGVFAIRDIHRGERFIPVEGEIRASPTRYSIQIGRDRHVDASHDDPPWKFMNHGCDPNVALSDDGRCFVALRDIRPGEEIRFNYLTTEWEMAEAFQCHCGAANCYGLIAGFKNLDYPSQMALLGRTTEHIREMFAESVASSPR